MKIKKYTGKTFKEALNDMKKELGDEAIILHSKKVKKGGSFDFLGGKEYYEITAAIDNEVPVKKGNGSHSGTPSAGYIYARPRPAAPEAPELIEKQERTEVMDTIRSSISEQKIAQQMSYLSDLKEEVRDMKKVLEQLSDFVKYSRMPALPQVFKNVLIKLLENDVHEELAKAIVQTAYARVAPQSYNNTRVVLETLFNLLRQMIQVAPPLEKVTRAPYVVTLVGPTGVGKTTTLAKIAAAMKLFHNRKVALISADTYRIAAIEQLQTFANIANIPMSVVYSPAEMQKAVLKYREKDVILIDTVGRSPKNTRQIQELQQFLEAAEPNEVHLVMSLTSSTRALMHIADKFMPLHPNRLIFTKTDESAGPGVLLNVVYKHRIPISYLTTGQTVPNDLIPATHNAIAKLVYKGAL